MWLFFHYNNNEEFLLGSTFSNIAQINIWDNLAYSLSACEQRVIIRHLNNFWRKVICHQNEFQSFLKTEYRGGLNNEHWNSEHIGILNVLKFGFSNGLKQDGCHFVLFSIDLNHWKKNVLESLVCFIYTHNLHLG